VQATVLPGQSRCNVQNSVMVKSARFVSWLTAKQCKLDPGFRIAGVALYLQKQGVTLRVFSPVPIDARLQLRPLPEHASPLQIYAPSSPGQRKQQPGKHHKNYQTTAEAKRPTAASRRLLNQGLDPLVDSSVITTWPSRITNAARNCSSRTGNGCPWSCKINCTTPSTVS